ALAADPRRHILGGRPDLHVVDRDIGALLREYLRDAAPDSAARSSDQRNFVRQLHVSPSYCYFLRQSGNIIPLPLRPARIPRHALVASPVARVERDILPARDFVHRRNAEATRAWRG